ncbi:MAG: helix-turn-helix transcriptional regulator [Lautropia sp.]
MDSDTLGLIYDAALDPARWADAIAGVARFCNSEGGQILLWNEFGAAPVFSLNVGGASDPAFADALYAQRYGAIDPRREYALSLPAGQWMACHQICDDRFVARSEFYQDYFIPIVNARYMCGTRLADEAGIHAMLAIARRRGPRSKPFDDATLAALGRLTPHLTRAANLHLRIAKLTGELSHREAALDRLSIPMFTTDQDGRALHMNRSAEDLAAVPNSRLSLKAGRLCSPQADDDVKLRSAIHSAVTASTGTSLLLGSDSAAPVLCTIVPLSERSAHLRAQAQAVALILVGDRALDGSFEQRLLEQVFALTPAEARLALGLATGSSPADYALAHRVSVNTVRAQLQAIYQKLGVKRQGAVIAMLQRLLPPLREPE